MKKFILITGILTFFLANMVHSQHSEVNRISSGQPTVNALKSTETYDFTLDSMYYFTYETESDSQLTNKFYYKFDAQKNPLETNKFSFDTVSGAWFVSYKSNSEWNSNGDQVSYSYLYQNLPTIAATGEKDDYTYNSANDIVLHYRLYWVDSLQLWKPYVKEEYEYFENGKRKSNTKLLIDNGTGDWYIYYKYDYGYDENGNNNTQTIYMAGGAMHSLSPYSKYESFFNENLTTDSTINSYWNQSWNDWQKSSKNERIYNSQNVQIQETVYTWDTLTNSWFNNSRSGNTYDEAGNQTSYYWYYWNADKLLWLGIYKSETWFDNFNRDTLIADYAWVDTNYTWRMVSKTSKTYIENSITELKIDYVPELDQWFNSGKTERITDGENDLLNIYYTWNNDSAKWTPFSKTERNYNNEGSETLNAYYKWSSEKNTWIGNSRIDQLYDAYNNLREYASFSWNGVSDEWQLSSKEIYYYTSTFIVDEIRAPLSENTITVYPNPFSDELSISVNDKNSGFIEAEIFDVNGRRILTSSGFGIITLNTAGLSPSVYFIKTRNNGKSNITKLLKVN